MKPMQWTVRDPEAADRLLRGPVYQTARSMTEGGHELVLTLGPVSKTRDQEEHYHALIGVIAKQAQHLGAKWGALDWKRLLLDEFAKDSGAPRGRIVPSLDGQGVVEVGIQSRKFSRPMGSKFIEWLYAWGSLNGVDFPERAPDAPEWVDPETGEITRE